ncbi:MAG: DEAD/DEAH box helicase [Clostridia bacterium]|nr:DEAD/DEAH box helicase [Clostridia bacterium]
MDSSELILKGAATAYLNSSINSNVVFKPEFISNNYKEGRKVLSNIEYELKNCKSFSINVAFITESGITPLLQTLKELEIKNVPGKILTTDYLNFSEPKALRRLAEFKNIELRMYSTEEAGKGFHAKGYMFKNDNVYKFIIGSSNMTQMAFSINSEWNTKIVTTESGEMTQKIVNEFEELWNSEFSYKFEDFITIYETNYRVIKEQREIVRKTKISPLESYKLKPNLMQLDFINKLNELYNSGENRALLISATGTGKTYASAFGLRDLKVNKVLFLVHREQIAKQAMRSYKKIFGDTRTFGLLSGNSKDFECDFLFSTMQMMGKEEVLHRFKPDEFDVIVIDEAHRIGATTYQNIIDYYNPTMLLGMTASPERTDSYDVFKAFDYNIACEIRLQQALEENMLCPFHYFGITDIEINGKTIDDDISLKDFNRLVSDVRLDYIIKQINYYGYYGESVKGLVFCSSKEEAKVLSNKFNERGYRTLALTGEDSQDRREDAIDRLTTDDKSRKIDYIFTVDIFNEGVDIPEINQVIMLRPTQSPIVFVQQLGRGLRKADNKEYVVILDFIGNYKNNFMIPIALSGDRTYNKDNIRRYVSEGEKIIPGVSSIHFDEISKKRIYEALDTANFSDVKLIKENYQNLKFKLGRIPNLMDFDIYGEMDVLRIFDNKSLGSYYKFLKKYEPEYKIELNKVQELIIEFISTKLADGKRIHELALLKLLINNKNSLISTLKLDLYNEYNINLTEYEIKSTINVLTNEFPAGTGKDTYKECVFIEKNITGDEYHIKEEFNELLKEENFLKIYEELIKFGIERYKRDYSNRYKDTNLVLYKKYTYEDVCRLLNWENNEVPINIGGYKYNKDTNTFPVFINYDKEDDISDTTKYEDRFIDSSKLISISKSGRSYSSEDVQNFLKSKEKGIKVELFVRKNKDDKISKEFYYLGRMYPTGDYKEFIMPNTKKSAVEIEWLLETTVREDIYEYIINE